MKDPVIQKVSVYCASSDKADQHYFDLASETGRILTEAKITVVYGGGAKGLMGHLADSVLQHQGKIIGIIPHFMKIVEWDHKGIDELIVVKDMAERKKQLLEVDAVVALPGGCGTFEELIEAISLKRLGKFTRPIIIVNYQGFYDPLLALLEKSIEEKFMRPEHRDIWTVIHDIKQLVPAIQQAPEWGEEAIQFAAV
ncbi:MAG: TIGR00730 family Rossman fold protein [Bacteroidota bacterium]